jgi:hypothetical protein
MINLVQRRELLRLAGIGGVVFASSLSGFARSVAAQSNPTAASDQDFYFIQISDSHWGYEGPNNPDMDVTLPKAIEIINDLSLEPDFIVFTGDLTHTTDDPYERRRRLKEFSQVVAELKVKAIHFMPGEHDAGLDFGTAYQEMYGPTYYTFAHKGVNFIALDNVSDPRGMGDTQLGWLKSQLVTLSPQARIVVFAHRPLFDLYPQWEWATRDGATAVDLLMPFQNVTVFYGHIHQENHHMTGHIAHHSAKSLAWPLPFPGSKPKPMPVPWNAAEPYKGLGVRGVTAAAAPVRYDVLEIPVTK